MTDELQRATVTGRTQGHLEPLIVGHGDTTIAPPPQVAEPPLSDGAAARVSVDVCREYERRICELEARLEALENKVDGDIMRWREVALVIRRSFSDVVGTINKQFGFNTKQ